MLKKPLAFLRCSEIGLEAMFFMFRRIVRPRAPHPIMIYLQVKAPNTQTHSAPTLENIRTRVLFLCRICHTLGPKTLIIHTRWRSCKASTVPFSFRKGLSHKVKIVFVLQQFPFGGGNGHYLANVLEKTRLSQRTYS